MDVKKNSFYKMVIMIKKINGKLYKFRKKIVLKKDQMKLFNEDIKIENKKLCGGY